MDNLLTAKQVCRKLQISRKTLANWLNSGKLVGYNLGSNLGNLRFKESDLDNLLLNPRQESNQKRSCEALQAQE